MTVENKIVIGIDQSYKNTGITIAENGRILQIRAIPLERCKTNTERRNKLHDELTKLFLKIQRRASHEPTDVLVIIERIRLQSQGFLNIDYIKSIGALNALIVDTASNYNYGVYSVDTRAWKSAIVGTSKPLKNKLGVNPEKYPTIKYVCSLGYKEQIIKKAGKKKKGVFNYKDEKYIFDDDAADSVCICLYGFLPQEKQLLKLEH